MSDPEECYMLLSMRRPNIPKLCQAIPGVLTGGVAAILVAAYPDVCSLVKVEA